MTIRVQFFHDIVYMSKDFLVHLLHIVIIGSLFLYIGIKQVDMPEYLFPGIAGLGLFIIIYHFYKAFYKKDAWVNYIHIFFIGPLLISIGILNKSAPRKLFEIVLMFAFASIGYHGYYLYQQF